MGCDRWRLSRPFRYLVVRPAGLIALLLLISVPRTAMAQETDTLGAARVSAFGRRPVLKPAEEILLDTVASPPYGIDGVLRRFTGVQVKDYGGVGGLKTVNVRSLGSEHTGIFLDGIQIDNAQNMQVDLGRFSTEGLGVVALYPGQKSVRLQSAKEYASGAAVYLESSRPSHKDGSGGHIRLRGGSFGTVSPSVIWDKVLCKGLSLRTGAEYTRTSGRYKYPFFGETLVRENGDLNSLRLEASLFGRWQRSEGMLRVYSYGSERGFPGPVIRRATGYPLSAERQADQDFFVQGNLDNSWTSRFATSVKFKYSNNYTHYDTHPERNPMALPYDIRYRQQSAYVSLAESFSPAEGWSLDLSTDYQFNALDSDAGQFVTPRRHSFYGALAIRRNGERFRAAAHLAYLGAWDRFRTPDAGGWSRENTFRDAWMPSLFLYYSPLKWLEADIFAKRSFRMPSFNDLYYTQMGNSALEPESAVQLGAGLTGSGNRGRWSWSARIAPYLNRVTDKIVAIPTSSQFRWTMLNIGTVDIAGLDAKADISFRHGEWSAGLCLRYSLQEALDHTDPESLNYGNQIPYIPLHSGSACLDAGWKGWTLAWNLTCTGGRWSRSANISDYYIKPWAISDASLSKKIPLPCFRKRVEQPSLKAGILCDNIFNTPYQIVQGYPMPGFNILLSVDFSW